MTNPKRQTAFCLQGKQQMHDCEGCANLGWDCPPDRGFPLLNEPAAHPSAIVYNRLSMDIELNIKSLIADLREEIGWSGDGELRI